MKRRQKHEKPWKKGTFSKELIKPYRPNAEDKAYMDAILLEMDASILVFNKPSGLACQTRNPDERTFDKLLDVYAKSNGKRPKLVHRLDAQTSGVIVSARTKPAAAFLSNAFAERLAAKTYLAIVYGEAFERKKGRIEKPLIRHQARPHLALMREAKSDEEGGQAAQTDYQVLASAGRYHFVKLMPQTGRMHQLRVHMALIGRPIIGDPYYGQDELKCALEVPRLALHAYRLNMPHPESGEIDSYAPLHDDMLGMLKSLKLEEGLLALTGKTG